VRYEVRVKRSEASGVRSEMETQIYLAQDLAFITNEQTENILNETIQIRKMIVGFQNTLKT